MPNSSSSNRSQSPPKDENPLSFFKEQDLRFNVGNKRPKPAGQSTGPATPPKRLRVFGTTDKTQSTIKITQKKIALNCKKINKKNQAIPVYHR